MSDRSPLRDYGRSLAVLMGTWDYKFLDRVPAAGHSLRRMESLLRGPLCGWPQARMLVLPNVPSPGDLPDRLITAFDAVTDVALFYFVGHGQIAPDDQLCLGLVQSRPEWNRRAATSLRFSDVRQALQDSSAAIKIVILDCCFAGLATKATLAAKATLTEDVLALTGGTNAYTMAATSAYTTAWYEDDRRLARPQTYFTKYLADLVETGIPGQPSRLHLDPLFKQLRENLATDRRPVPYSRAVNDARDFVFAYNAAPPEAQRDPEQELAALAQRLAATDAQMQALEERATGRERELARLKQILASAETRDAGQQRKLLAAIDNIARQLDGTRAAIAALTADSQESSEPDHDRPDGQPGPPQSTTTPQSSGDHPATVGELRLTPEQDTPVRPGERSARSRRLLIIALACALLAAAVAIPLVLTMPGPSPAPYLTLTDSHSKGVTSVAFGPGGTTLAAADKNGKIYLWNIESKTNAVFADPGSRGVTSVAFGPGGTTLAAADKNGKIYLWNIESKTNAVFADPDSRGVTSVAFGPGGTTLAAADDNGKTYLWNTTTKMVIAAFPTNPGGGGVSSVAFGPGGTTLAAADDIGDIWLSDIKTRNITATLAGLPGNAAFSAVASAPGAPTLAAAGANGSTYLLDASGKILHTLTDPTSRGVTSVALEPGGTSLAVVDKNGLIYLWDTRTRKITGAFPDPVREGVTSVAFEPGGTTLAAADANGSIFLWRLRGDHLAVRTPTATSTRSGPFTATLNATFLDLRNMASLRLVAFEPGGTDLAAVDDNGLIYLWDIPAGTMNTTVTHPLKTFSDPGSAGVYSVALGPGGALAVGDDNGRAYLWDTNTTSNDPVDTFIDPGSAGVYSVAFGPGGTTLAAGDDNGNTYLWNIPAGMKNTTLTRPVKKFTDPDSAGVSSVAFGPGGTILAAGDYNGNTYLWNTKSGQPITTFPDSPSKGVYFVTPEPGGTTLAVHDGNGRIYLWNITRSTKNALLNDPVNTFTDPHSKGLYSVTFGPGGTLATGDDNGHTYLWNITTGQLIAVFPDFASNGVYFVASEPGGTTLAAADGNGRIYLWDTTGTQPSQ